MDERRILIVGAGPSGLTAALELKRRGYTPMIIDRLMRPHSQSRALAINPRTLQILEASGVTDKLLERGWRMSTVHFRGPAGDFLRFDLTNLSEPYNFIVSLPQHETEMILERALGEAGVLVQRDCELISVEEKSGRLTAIVQTADGSEATLHPDMVIGADGVHSTVRASMGQTFTGSTYSQDWGLVDVELEPTISMDGPTIFDRAPNLFAVIPFSATRARIVTDISDPLEELPVELQVTKVYWRSSFRISHRLADAYQKGRMFLVGDAAHVHSPFGGRGMNLGIEDAAWLAWLVAEGRTDRYEQDRRPVAEDVLKEVDSGTQFLTSHNTAIRLFRQRLFPVVGRRRYFQERFLRIMSAETTPFPPWLKEA